MILRTNQLKERRKDNCPHEYLAVFCLFPWFMLIQGALQSFITYSIRCDFQFLRDSYIYMYKVAVMNRWWQPVIRHIILVDLVWKSVKVIWKSEWKQSPLVLRECSIRLVLLASTIEFLAIHCARILDGIPSV